MFASCLWNLAPAVFNKIEATVKTMRYSMDTDKKESSELSSLMLTKDFFKKVVVRMDVPHSFYDDNGIFHCNLIDLLLGRVELF